MAERSVQGCIHSVFQKVPPTFSRARLSRICRTLGEQIVELLPYSLRMDKEVHKKDRQRG